MMNKDTKECSEEHGPKRVCLECAHYMQPCHVAETGGETTSRAWHAGELIKGAGRQSKSGMSPDSACPGSEHERHDKNSNQHR